MTDSRTPQEFTIEKILSRLDTSKLEDYSDETLSISDITTALNNAYEKGYEERAQIAMAEPKVIFATGDGVVLLHRNNSKIVGTLTENGNVSHPAGYAELTELGQNGWSLIAHVPAAEFAGREFLGY
ncbi:hypothetical protein HOT31_gp099 [Microbacterium phage Hendrix]|uniref:Uncharacterized protein n=1 Tax=Microbacterium phage Hendrix TaxID=2182341 RepID=A0A2U8UUC8_9CAUD|nr:hypothetical protein HOT31_gp099 [Microbacterium phage Hendrix]AWN07770.1 hypothetical protein PBI_HENDRIX_99 [Microbacterium phage Hendrix]